MAALGVATALLVSPGSVSAAEIGPSGYSSWQISDDTGRNARNCTVHDQVHAAGGQLGLTYLPWNSVVNFKYLHEFAAEDRFQGRAMTFSFVVKF